MDDKKIVKKLISEGFTHTDAMIVLGFICEERQKAYMQGYNKGYDDGVKEKK